MTNFLRPGDAFPPISVAVPGAEATIELPDTLEGQYSVILLFRGAWCPYCNAQLRAFQRAEEKLASLDIGVVALSTESEADTVALIEKHGLTFPVGHSADAEAVAEATGAFVNPGPAFLQSTGFVLDPEGRVVVSVYSSGAIGRLLPDDVVGLVRYLRDAPTAASAP